MLRITTLDIEGESFTIQQLSAFRVLGLERKTRSIKENNDEMIGLVVDTLQRCVLVSEDNPVKRFATEADMEEADISLPQMIKLKEAIIDFSQQPADGGSLTEVADAIKN